MIVNYREKMREYLKEPNEICNHYGKWGILNKEQRDLIIRLLNEMDRADNYIIKLQQENQKYEEVIDEAIKLIEDSYYSKNTTDIDSIVISGDKLLQVRKILKGDE